MNTDMAISTELRARRSAEGRGQGRSRVSKVNTSEGFVGTKTALVTLRKGTYRFFCAPHAEDMHGSFRAVA